MYNVRVKTKEHIHSVAKFTDALNVPLLALVNTPIINFSCFYKACPHKIKELIIWLYFVAA